MSDRPIIFSGPMVRAILNGRKTQTRRVLKEQRATKVWQQLMPSGCLCWFGDVRHEYGSSSILSLVAPGDRLWVREAWNITHRQHLAPGEDIERSAEDCVAANGGFACACADGVVYQATAAQSHPEYGKALWRPSIHMPRWASRLTLIVEDVRVQRLQEISEEDAVAEGCRPFFDYDHTESVPTPDGFDDIEMAPLRTPTYSFRDLWNNLNAKRGYGWDENPWVVALTFRAIQKNIVEVKDDE